MSKIVVAGCSDCPYFAKVELLADRLQRSLPNFRVHKIVKTRTEWKEWVNEISKANNWKVKESPIIWRELVDRGGKGHLIGGPNEFQEYVRCYYDIISDMSSGEMEHIAKDNIRFKNEEDQENRNFKALSNPTKVCICGAMNAAVPHFVLPLASGKILGENTELSIVFLDNINNMSLMKSLQMSTFDMAFPLVRSISITVDLEAALTDCSLVVIFDTLDVSENELLETRLKQHQELFEQYGSIIERCCATDVKVLLVPSGTMNMVNISLIALYTKLNRIPKYNVVGLSRLFEQHARSVLATKMSVHPINVHNVVVWGNIGGVHYVDVSNVKVHKFDGAITGPEPFSLSASNAIWDKKWLNEEMRMTISNRFSDISKSRIDGGSPLALAWAISSFLTDWISGDSMYGYVHSLVVLSDGEWYNVPKGMAFSLPVTLNPKGYWTVVQDLELSEEDYMRIKECIEDLNGQIRVMYPEMNNNSNNQNEMAIDEAFVDSEIKSLLEEMFSKSEINSVWSLIKNSLSIEERLDISRSKELLLRTIEDLRKPPKVESEKTGLSESTTKELTKLSEPEKSETIMENNSNSVEASNENRRKSTNSSRSNESHTKNSDDNEAENIDEQDETAKEDNERQEDE